MYYRNYFSGTISSNTDYRTIQNIANAGTISNYYNQTDVVCQAVKRTLDDVGVTCEYDESTAILHIEGISLQVVCNGSTGTICFSIKELSLGTLSQSICPFSTKNYKFYVTIKGDKDGILQIFIGQYSNPAAEIYGVVIGKGIDLRDGEDIQVVYGLSIDTSHCGEFYILKNNILLPEYKKKIPFGYKFTAINELNENGIEITLIECIAQSGRFKLNNCYFGHASLTVNEFFNIGGDIYYYLSQCILVKCVNG